jgi:hypothetical protein
MKRVDLQCGTVSISNHQTSKTVKILSFYTTDLDGEQSRDLTIFFEMTDTEYNRMMEIPFNHVEEMYDHCKTVSDGEWNSTLFEDDHELTLTFAYEHTTQSIFTFN